jgi:hypothetical protein
MSLKNFTLSIAFLMLISCNKNAVEKIQPLTAHDIELKSLPLIQIKGYLLGKWKLIYAFGGISGHVQIDYPDSYVDFSTVDFISWTRDGAAFAQSPLTWVPTKDIFAVNTNVMQFKNLKSELYTWGAERIRNDTLVLYDNDYDGFRYFLVKKQ